MFNKSKMKAKVHFEDRSEFSSTSSTSIPLSDAKLLQYLRDHYRRYGSLILDYVGSDGEIRLITQGTHTLQEQEEKLRAIDETIRDYINNRAIAGNAYAVFQDGKLTGVFGQESLALLKQNSLISRGADSETVEMKPIEINSFQSFE